MEAIPDDEKSPPKVVAPVAPVFIPFTAIEFPVNCPPIPNPGLLVDLPCIPIPLAFPIKVFSEKLAVAVDKLVTTCNLFTGVSIPIPTFPEPFFTLNRSILFVPITKSLASVVPTKFSVVAMVEVP